MTYREIIYMCLDEIKAMSDDAYVTEDHILFLVSKYRSFLLKQKYDKTNMPVEKSNYQHIYVYPNAGVSLPSVMDIAKPIVYLETWSIKKGAYVEYFTYVPYNRFRFVCNNKNLKNIKYCTIDLNNYFRTKEFKDKEDDNIQTSPAVTKINFYAVFEDFRDIQPINLDDKCPIEDALAAGVIELVVKEIVGIAYRPADKVNNGVDDLSIMGTTQSTSK